VSGTPKLDANGDVTWETQLDSLVRARIDEMRDALLNQGISITRRRDKMLQALASNERHPSVNELHAEVRRWYPSTSLATIYNTIELLKEAGQILELEFSGAANRYDGRRPESHPHLICLTCESIEDMDGESSDADHLDRLSEHTGYRLMRQRTDYYGICPTCQQQAVAASD
jgi:Fur family peroxide stress response transcriptional regulator